MMKDHLEKLAVYFNGQIQFAWVNVKKEELLKYSFSAYKTPRSYYIDNNGISYGFEIIVTSFN